MIACLFVLGGIGMAFAFADRPDHETMSGLTLYFVGIPIGVWTAASVLAELLR